MPDVVELIKAQHRTIDDLLTQAEDGKGDIRALLQQVSDLLLPHSEAEESFVYPSIKKLKSSEESEVKDGVAEHHHMEGMLQELLQEEPGSPGFDGKLAAFVGELRHHVEEEEQDLLPVLSEKASDSERKALGERFSQETGDDDSSASASSSGASSGGSGSDDSPSKQELYEKAKDQDVAGRSSMSKEELEKAVDQD